jgi:hypothetical protein
VDNKTKNRKRHTNVSERQTTATIRLHTKIVQFITHLKEDGVFSERGYRFSGIGSDRGVYDLPASVILNREEIDNKISENPEQFLRIVTPERLAWSIGMQGITFSRTIELPK